jgi:aryl-alcohol dehydrogenase-like predicted oxidoreductase
MKIAFPRRQIGKSGLSVSPLGLGCWQFSQGRGPFGNYWGILHPEAIREIVRVSLDGGINWFDTAEAYGNGKSEQALSQALRSLNVGVDNVIIATKWQPFLKTAGSLGRTIGERLKALGGYPISLYQIHQPLSISSIRAQMKAMADLVQSKKIRFVGVSNFSTKRMKIAHDELRRCGLILASNQMKYSLLDRRIETNGVLETARELGISIISYSPLAQGLLTGRFHKNPGEIKMRPGLRKYMPAFRPKGLEKSRPVILAVQELAEKYGRTPAQIALNWLLQAQGELVVAIPGATKVSQAQENAGALTFALTQDDIDYLTEVSAPFISMRL